MNSEDAQGAVKAESPFAFIRSRLRHVAVRNVLLLYVVQFSSYLMPLVTLPYLSHVLGPEKFGLVAYAQSFMWYFITLTEYSFNLTATRRVAAHANDAEEISKTFAAVMASKFLLTLLGLVVLMTAVLSVPKLRPNWDLFLVCFLSVAGNFLFPLWLFQGLQRLEQVALRDFLAKLVGIVALFALVHKDSDYVLAAGVQSGSLAVAGLIGLASVPFLSPVKLRWPAVRDIREALHTGWPLFLSLAATSFAAVTNVVIMGLQSSTKEVGYYSGAQRIIAALRTLVGPVVTALYPMVSAKGAISEMEVVRFVRKYVWIISGPFLVMGILLITGGPWLIGLALGHLFGPSVLVMRVMAFSPFLLALSNVYSTCYMLACGYDRAWMRLMLLSVLVNFVLLFPLLYFVRGSLALAITSMGTDAFAVAAYWRFYRMHAPRGD